jgi:hypothetical protein
MRPLRILSCCIGLAGALSAQTPTTGVDLSGDQHPDIREALGTERRSVGDWIERFDLSGLFAARYLHTGSGGKYPDGAFQVNQANLFTRAAIKDVGEVFLELRLEYFPDDDDRGVGLGEAYLQLRDLGRFGGADLGVKVGRFDLPFGEYYLLEDPDQNRMIGYPALIPYRWDEGVQAYLNGDGWGANLSISDGSYSRNSSAGVAPAICAKLHTQATPSLYLSASTLYIDGAAQSALCFGGSVITPVAGSPSPEVKSWLGSLDMRWEPHEQWLLQASLGGGRIDDDADAFDRDLFWWILEPSYAMSTEWRLTARWSGAGTFDGDEGYQFEGRPYGNGATSFGFDVHNFQRLAAGVAHTFHPNLLGKLELGVDRFLTSAGSSRDDDSRLFFGAELVATF